jgi:chaperonin GroES
MFVTREVIAVIQPLGDKVVVKPGPEEERTPTGIVLPDTAKKKPQEGEVVAIGSGKLLENGQRAPMQVKVGDTVVYSKYGGTEVEVDGTEYVVLDEDQILAVKT